MDETSFNPQDNRDRRILISIKIVFKGQKNINFRNH